MPSYQGQCQCGRVTLRLSLPTVATNYQARACDCNFCTNIGAAYVSDPKGQLTIEGWQHLAASKQGSEQADFWRCQCCGDLVAVSCDFPSGRRGAVNAAVIPVLATLPRVSASPQHLSPQEKYQRWQQLWLQVTLSDNGQNEHSHPQSSVGQI